MRSLRILVLPAKRYPCDHPMLGSVFASQLPERGHSVEWVMPSDNPSGTARWAGSRVHVVHTGTRSFLDAVLGSMAVARRALRAAGSRVDIVQVRNSVRLALLGMWIRRRHGAKLVFQLSFPDAERSIAMARAGRLSVPMVRVALGRARILLRRFVMRRADLVLAISDAMRDGLIAEGFDAEKVTAFPLGAEPMSAGPAELRRWRDKLGLADAPVITYLGAIAPERRLEFLIDVAEALERSHPEARWLLVGPSTDGEADRLKSLAISRGLDDVVRFVDPVPHAEVPALLGLASLTVSPIPPDPLFATSSPTKTVESLAAGRPVVGTPIPDQAALLEAGGGLVAPFEPKAFADVIALLLDDPELARSMGEWGRDLVVRTRSYDLLTDLLESRYQELVRVGSPVLSLSQTR
jgi:glycosyltransferase involved in cell wall biosynthesis